MGSLELNVVQVCTFSCRVTNVHSQTLVFVNTSVQISKSVLKSF